MNHPTEKHAHRNPWQKYTGEKTEWVCGFCDEPMNQPECAALTKKNPTMTTREEEILEAIGKPACSSGEHREDYEYVFSPRKLATYLAELEEKIIKYTT